MQFWQRCRKFSARIVEFPFSNLGIGEKRFKDSKKNRKWAMATENAVLSTVQKESPTVKLISVPSPKKMKTTNFFEEFCIFSKLILRTSKMRIWKPLWSFPTKVRHIFLLANQKWWKICYSFQRKTNFSSNVHRYT